MYKAIIAVLMFLMLFSCSKKEINNQILMYVGTSNGNPEKGIEMCYFDTVSGGISATKLCAQILNPNYLAIDVKNNLLFSVGKLSTDSDEIAPVVVSHSVNPNSGELVQLSTNLTYGDDPCYVAYNSSTQNIYIANYGSGNVSNYIFSEGNIKHKNTLQHYGSGPDKNRQNEPHAHSINEDLETNFVYSADLGSDKLMVYNVGDEGLQKVDSVICHAGGGPRHFDFSPNGKLMAVLNELDCAVSFYRKNDMGIFKEELNTLSMLPDTFSGFSKAADVHFSPDGKFLYASNRGFNSIAIFKVLEGGVEFVDWETHGINWPRNFTLDPTGKYILVANRDSNNITVYKRNLDSGLLTKLSHTTSVEKPVCLKFFY